MGHVIGGRWTLERLLGRGATAAVYRAQDGSGRLAAVKVLFSHMASDPEVRRRFAQEVRVVSGMSHPGIVRIVDHDVADPEEPYIAFEHLAGETLASRAEREPLSIRELLDVADQVLDALSVAHDQQVVHRDLKPENVFLASDGGVKILDFGVARVGAPECTAVGTQLGMAIGTVAYMAPEQALGKHQSVDARTDLFSLGAMLFRLLSGQPVHRASTVGEALQLTSTKPARSLAEACPELPSELVAIVDMSLAFSQEARYPDARAMQQDVRALLAGAPGSIAGAARASRQSATLVPGSAPNVEQAVVAPTQLAQPEKEAAVPDEREAADPLIGTVVADRYRVEALLGAGGMGAVYRAEHVHMKKQVALKLLHPSMTARAEAVARFEREAVAAARIEHPNVAGAKDFGRLEDGSFYLVLEYVKGKSLRRWLKSHGALPIERVRELARQVASALVAAHRLGIVHRDLKPENIMLVARPDGSDFVKVLDFGIAKLTREPAGQAQLTQFGAVFGTPEYMSPEQAAGMEVSDRSDVYSLGIILYELIAGTTPFRGRDTMAVLTAQMTEVPAPLDGAAAGSLAGLTLRMLDKQHAQRPSAEQVLLELSACSPKAALDSGHPRWDWLSRFGVSTAVAFESSASWVDRKLSALGVKERVGIVWAVAALSLLFGGVLVLVVSGFSGSDEAAAPRMGTAKSPVHAASVSVVEPASVSESTRREVQRIEALPVYKRAYQDWLILARSLARMGRFKDSAVAYRAVLSLRASMREDPELLEDLRSAARDPDAFNLVLNLCATQLKQRGVDLLWDAWREFRSEPQRAEQASVLQRKLVVLSRHASPALRTAIELENAQSCDRLHKAVLRAREHSDTRAVDKLKRLELGTGCGEAGAFDCYPCLRQDDGLARALKHAAGQPAPEFGR